MAKAWEYHGHRVRRVQEGDIDQLLNIFNPRPDLILWTRTGDLAAKVGHPAQIAMLNKAADRLIPTVGFHLDRWFGLERESQVASEPFFKCSLVITADGGHQDNFVAAGVNHMWLPPAVSLAETELGAHTTGFHSSIVFVGSWRGYHPEWTHRPELVSWLRKTYGHNVTFWPSTNQPAIRGEALRNLYASAKVVVGDSCLSGGATHYWSDRIPETVGRGGFLLHPNVEGLNNHFNIGEHLDTWDAYDWPTLQTKLDYWLRHDHARKAVQVAGREHVRTNHTYEVRVEQIIKVLAL